MKNAAYKDAMNFSAAYHDPASGWHSAGAFFNAAAIKPAPQRYIFDADHFEIVAGDDGYITIQEKTQ